MGFNFGQISEFQDANSKAYPVVEALGRAISLPRFKGVVFGMMGAPMTPITQKSFEVYTRTLTSRNGAIGNAAAGDWGGTTATTGLPIAAAADPGITVGHVLQIDNEVVIVKSIDHSAHTIAVYQRGDAGTTAATHASATAFTVLGHAGMDTSLKNVESISESTKVYKNYIQTVFETLDWEKSAELKRRGLAAERILAILQQEAAIRVANMLCTMAVLGKPKAGTASAPFMSAGLLHQLADTNGGDRAPLIKNVAGKITEDVLRKALQSAMSYGNPTELICSWNNKETINGFNKVATTMNSNRTERTAGYQIDEYNYEGVLLHVSVDIDMPDDKIAIVTPNLLKKGWLEDDMLKYADEPAASSREHRSSLSGSIGFLVEGVGYDHMLLTGITQ